MEKDKNHVQFGNSKINKNSNGNTNQSGTVTLVDDTLKEKKKKTIKLMMILIFILIILILATIAWFTSNRDVETSGMGVKVQAMPYTILTRSASGYYQSQWTSLDTNALEWKIDATNNFDNDISATAEGETEPALEPGDHGTLEFRVQPNNADSLTVNCFFDIKGYSETTSGTSTEISEIGDSVLTGYIKSHILLFEHYDDTTQKYSDLIWNNTKLERVIQKTYQRTDNTFTTIYWVWPKYLSQLTSENANDIIYSLSDRGSVRNYIAANRTGFFKGCTETQEQVARDLTTLSESYNNQIFNRYNIKYDSADLEIGNNISYVMLSMQVEDTAD
mgnify:CR=1 FL=1